MSEGTTTLEAVYGRLALDRDGNELGTIEAVYLDRETGEAVWAGVRVGNEYVALVPLSGAQVTDEGVQLVFDERLARGAPGGSEVLEELPPALEAELYHYYSLDYSGASDDGDVRQRLPSGPADAG